MISIAACMLAVASLLCTVDAQNSDMPMSGMSMDMQEMSRMPSPHAGSGTAWQPASVPEPEWM